MTFVSLERGLRVDDDLPDGLAHTGYILINVPGSAVWVRRFDSRVIVRLAPLGVATLGWRCVVRRERGLRCRVASE